MASVRLFETLSLGEVTFRNRIAVSPMCQYSSEDGFASDWHLVHLGSHAVGGAGIVFTEAAAVEARGRISPQDLGIWKDEHVPMLARIAGFVSQNGSVPGIQLAHAGRKASVRRPWEGGAQISLEEGGWPAVAPSELPFRETERKPEALSVPEIHAIAESFAAATRRSAHAGMQVIELHAAHGYLLHEFYSPLSNSRTDCYGGSFENRIRFTCETVEAIRGAWPKPKPLFVRVSASDWVEGNWTIEDSVRLAIVLKGMGVDLIDCSSGGNSTKQRIAAGPGYQVPFSRRIRAEAGIATGAVGMITDPAQAETILRTGDADIVLLAREMLRDPYWPLHAAKALGEKPAPPVQYERAF